MSESLTKGLVISPPLVDLQRIYTQSEMLPTLLKVTLDINTYKSPRFFHGHPNICYAMSINGALNTGAGCGRESWINMPSTLIPNIRLT